MAETDHLSARDRFIRRLMGFLIWMLYRDVNVFYASESKDAGAEISVANHFGGVADALVLVYGLDRRPRIIARDTIWRIPVVGFLMSWIGSIPVHKSEDPGPNRNDEMFASTYEALRKGQHLLIFPEGITVDDPAIAPIKTGVARIALGARASGAQGILIRPAGIHYENKAALRSRVFVNIGTALDLDDKIGDYVVPGSAADASNRAAVRRLTDDVELRLRRVAPNFNDWDEARALTSAAEVAIRSLGKNPNEAVPIGERDRLASVLGRAPEAERDRVIATAQDYDSELDALGVTDRQFLTRLNPQKFVGYLVRSFLLVAVLLPFALAGAAVNIIPFLIVKAVGLLRVSPAVKATLKPVAAILSFGLAWGIYSWLTIAALDFPWWILGLALLPVYLGAAIVLFERVVLLWRVWITYWSKGRSVKVWEETMTRRGKVVDAVADAV